MCVQGIQMKNNLKRACRRAFLLTGVQHKQRAGLFWAQGLQQNCKQIPHLQLATCNSWLWQSPLSAVVVAIVVCVNVSAPDAALGTWYTVLSTLSQTHTPHTHIEDGTSARSIAASDRLRTCGCSGRGETSQEHKVGVPSFLYEDLLNKACDVNGFDFTFLCYPFVPSPHTNPSYWLCCFCCCLIEIAFAAFVCT